MLFEHNALVYLALILVPIASLLLYQTQFGLTIRAVGESPDAVDTRGINVSWIRYLSLVIGGALAWGASTWYWVVWAYSGSGLR